jgi:hypothetical protein
MMRNGFAGQLSAAGAIAGTARQARRRIISKARFMTISCGELLAAWYNDALNMLGARTSRPIPNVDPESCRNGI